MPVVQAAVVTGVPSSGRLFLICMALAVGACGGRGVNLDPPSEAAGQRSALAVVIVENQTAVALEVAFRTATPPRQQVGIGRVLPHARTRMAPLPAVEPIILVARRADGAEYRMLARSFPLDAEWTWIIPKDAEFTMPEQHK